MKITDSLTFDASGLNLTRDGYLVGEAKVSRAGNVQQYYGAELGLTGDDAGRAFGVYRDPEVVFDETSMMSLAGRPVTRGHPPEGVTADNWRDLTVGQMGGTIKRDGEHVVAPMAIMDTAAAKEVADGARSLSAGYTVDVVPDDGAAEDGTPYQFRQAGALRFNHVAYLPDNNPRAGNTRIGDDAGDGGKDRNQWGARPVIDHRSEKELNMTLKTVTVDGIPIEVTDQGATVIGTLQKRVTDAETKLTDAEKAHKDAIAAKDKDLAKKDAEIEDLKKKVLDDKALDARVQDRADLVGKAKTIVADVKTEGVSDHDIRKAVVVAKRGEDAVKDKSEAYIDAAFDLIAEDSEKGTKTDPLRDTGRITANDGGNAWGDSVFASAGVPMKKEA